MISKTLYAFQRGLLLMRSNTKLLLVGFLVFVLPLMFIWTTNAFFTATHENIQTAQKHRVGTVHDAVRALLLAEVDQVQLQTVVTTISSSTLGDSMVLNGIKVYRETAEGFVIIASTDDLSSIGQIEEGAESIKNVPFSEQMNFSFSPYNVDGKSIWQVYERVRVGQDYYYIFSQFDLTIIEKTLAERKQDAYLVLSFVFVFLIALAYWLRTQIDWENNYRRVLRQLKERDNFSNMMAHELRSPLTAVRGFASFLIESKTISDSERRYAENIEVSARRLVDLVNDFLEVARLHSGKLSSRKVPVNLSELIPNALTGLEEVAKKKGLSLRYETNHRAYSVESDPDRLTQVIINLVSNAIKYSERGAIAVACEDTRKGMTIRVKDTGTGISAEDQQKLFAQFSRVGGVDDKPITGSGLGMWITKQIVELLGGTIGVESIQGIGTHVVITFKHN
jgi:signal transduction histidine kinase